MPNAPMGDTRELDVPELDLERLFLVPLSYAHSDGMFALWREPEVCRYSGPAFDEHGEAITLPARSAADSDKLIAFFVAHRRAGKGFRWAMLLRESKGFIGALGFNSLGTVGTDEFPELAFHLNPSYWRHGYTREACIAAIAWAHDALAARLVEAWAEDANTASVGLLSRLGFVATEKCRDGARRYLRSETENATATLGGARIPATEGGP